MTGGDERLRQAGEELLLLSAYLLSSARGLLTEPPAYGPLRCLDAARRTLTLARQLAACDNGLNGLPLELDAFMSDAMEERDLETLLDNACCHLAELLRAKETDRD
ncbi:DUF6092 family protein [Streptomyces sp. AC627_RSS907]|uniref:DUF6092 family protein n=1 Tax=Streptomyces sp. AC627_RSS907 TaxID=2823684 RepID=UPI001C241DCB|nr:DUF6092 family protein [Streptomyces sp. AC627_RSS907]